MVLTNPRSPGLSRFFYLLSVFLALVALPFCMGMLMAFHPFGAWSNEIVSEPLKHMHPMSMLLIIFSGWGFAFWCQEAWFRFGFRHARRVRVAAWIWAASWLGTFCFLARMGALHEVASERLAELVIVMLLGVWLPLFFVFKWKALPLTAASGQ